MTAHAPALIDGRTASLLTPAKALRHVRDSGRFGIALPADADGTLFAAPWRDREHFFSSGTGRAPIHHVDARVESLVARTRGRLALSYGYPVHVDPGGRLTPLIYVEVEIVLGGPGDADGLVIARRPDARPRLHHGPFLAAGLPALEVEAIAAALARQPVPDMGHLLGAIGRTIGSDLSRITPEALDPQDSPWQTPGWHNLPILFRAPEHPVRAAVLHDLRHLALAPLADGSGPDVGPDTAAPSEAAAWVRPVRVDLTTERVLHGLHGQSLASVATSPGADTVPLCLALVAQRLVAGQSVLYVAAHGEAATAVADRIATVFQVPRDWIVDLTGAASTADRPGSGAPSLATDGGPAAAEDDGADPAGDLQSRIAAATATLAALHQSDPPQPAPTASSGPALSALSQPEDAGLGPATPDKPAVPVFGPDNGPSAAALAYLLGEAQLLAQRRVPGGKRRHRVAQLRRALHWCLEDLEAQARGRLLDQFDRGGLSARKRAGLLVEAFAQLASNRPTVPGTRPPPGPDACGSPAAQAPEAQARAEHPAPPDTEPQVAAAAPSAAVGRSADADGSVDLADDRADDPALPWPDRLTLVSQRLVRDRWRQRRALHSGPVPRVTDVLHTLGQRPETLADPQQDPDGPLIRYLDTVMDALPVWIATPQSALHLLPLAEGLFDQIIIDGADRLDAALAVPILHRARTAVMLGLPAPSTPLAATDPPPPPVDLFAMMADRVAPLGPLLRTDHSHPHIADYLSAQFCGGALRICSPSVLLQSTSVPDWARGIRVWPFTTDETAPEQDLAVEWDQVRQILRALRDAGLTGSKSTVSIGVISPLPARLQAMKAHLRQEWPQPRVDRIAFITPDEAAGRHFDLVVLVPGLTHSTPSRRVPRITRGIDLYRDAVAAARIGLHLVVDGAEGPKAGGFLQPLIEAATVDIHDSVPDARGVGPSGSAHSAPSANSDHETTTADQRLVARLVHEHGLAYRPAPFGLFVWASDGTLVAVTLAGHAEAPRGLNTLALIAEDVKDPAAVRTRLAPLAKEAA